MYDYTERFTWVEGGAFKSSKDSASTVLTNLVESLEFDSHNEAQIFVDVATAERYLKDTGSIVTSDMTVTYKVVGLHDFSKPYYSISQEWKTTTSYVCPLSSKTITSGLEVILTWV